METLTIKVDTTANAMFLQELLLKFQFVKAVETGKKQKASLEERYKTLPIHWATEKPSIADFTNIVSDRKLSLTEIREKAWKRSL